MVVRQLVIYNYMEEMINSINGHLQSHVNVGLPKGIRNLYSIV